MPWLETAPMEQRERFVRDWQLGLYTMTELGARYAISRKTGYQWLERFDEGGRQALGDRSRAPHHCPHRISDEMARLICDARRQLPVGDRKNSCSGWRRGIPPSTCRRSAPGGSPGSQGPGEKTAPPTHVHTSGRRAGDDEHPNDLWTADFKGQFRTGDGIYCYPLTVADQHTRYLLGCQGLLSTNGTGVRPIFDRLFRTYGLPRAIRTDNGVPFATVAIHGLSALNVWWLRLGIQHQRILPAHPEQNGAHERMHKTLKAEAIRPARSRLAMQQRAFNRFRNEYNHERPHQSLRGRTPGSLYRSSARTYTGELPPFEYPGHFLVKHVTNAGTFRFKKRVLFIANGLIHHRVGLEIHDGIWSIYFCRVLIGRLDERDYVIRA